MSTKSELPEGLNVHPGVIWQFINVRCNSFLHSAKTCEHSIF